MKQSFSRTITVDPAVRFGKPVIAGTRVSVDLIMSKLAGGMEIDDLTREYDLTKKQVRAALQYAAELVASETVAFA